MGFDLLPRSIRRTGALASLAIAALAADGCSSPNYGMQRMTWNPYANAGGPPPGLYRDSRLPDGYLAQVLPNGQMMLVEDRGANVAELLAASAVIMNTANSGLQGMIRVQESNLRTIQDMNDWLRPVSSGAMETSQRMLQQEAERQRQADEAARQRNEEMRRRYQRR